MSRQLHVIGSPAILPPCMLDALNAVTKADPNAILAGGAVRDTLNGKDVKDIDIFVGPDVTAERLNEVSPEYEWTVQYAPEVIRDYLRCFGSVVETVIQGLPAGLLYDDFSVEPPVQVVVLNTPVTPEVIYRMDFGFCQVGVSAREEVIYVTPAFLLDMQANTATLCGEGSDPARSQRRAERLAEKYPTRRFILQASP